MSYEINQGDCLDSMRKMPDASVNCCVTSPPYFGLRDYGHEGQIGLEETPDAYVAKLVEVFREVRRVLRDDGTLWLNLGDSYALEVVAKSTLSGGMANQLASRSQPSKMGPGLKRKDLIGIPWRVAFALQADGWWLRQDIIWSKPNVMPESVRDRCTKAHEYLFLLAKSERYYFDSESFSEPARNWGQRDRTNLRGGTEDPKLKHNGLAGAADVPDPRRNRRSVWTVSPKPYSGAHFAVFPPELIRPCILAGCPAGGTVLDPFGGSGTTAQVALEHDRNAILCELNPAYVELIHERLSGLQYRISA